MRFWKRKSDPVIPESMVEVIEVKLWAREALNIARRALGNWNSLEDKILMCDYMIRTFKMEYVAHFRTHVFRSESPDSITPLVFPYEIPLPDGSTFYFRSTEKVLVKLGDSTATRPFDYLRQFRILPIIKEQGFIYDKYNHEADYYPYIDLAVVTSGRHSCSSGAFLHDGEIPMDSYDITQLFDHIYFDGGRYWCSKYTQQPLGIRASPHIGVIFEIARIKHSLEQELANSTPIQS